MPPRRARPSLVGFRRALSRLQSDPGMDQLERLSGLRVLIVKIGRIHWPTEAEASEAEDLIEVAQMLARQIEADPGAIGMG